MHDKDYGDGAGTVRPNLKSGARIPIDIISEIDRKTDDGRPESGSFQLDKRASVADDKCVKDKAWDGAAGVSNCAGASLF
jgi:hypothetical protein